MKEAIKVDLEGYYIEPVIVPLTEQGITEIYETPETEMPEEGEEPQPPEPVLVGYRVAVPFPDGFAAWKTEDKGPRYDIDAWQAALEDYDAALADYHDAMTAYDPESEDPEPQPPAPVDLTAFWVEGLTQEEIDVINPPVTLEDVKQAKISELNKTCNAEILSGFTSSALGTEHQYPFDEMDQLNMSGALTLINADSTLTSITWKTIDSGPMEHTKEQFINLCKDSFIFKQTRISKYWTLKAQILSADSESDVQAIVW